LEQQVIKYVTEQDGRNSGGRHFWKRETDAEAWLLDHTNKSSKFEGEICWEMFMSYGICHIILEIQKTASV
jgi:hypothetical protein